MRRSSSILAAMLAASLLTAAPVLAQAPSSSSDTSVGQTATGKAGRARSARSTREPTASQMAARERQRKCGAEWKEAKAANRTAGMKWPQYWSRCNARLKGNQA